MGHKKPKNIFHSLKHTTSVFIKQNPPLACFSQARPTRSIWSGVELEFDIVFVFGFFVREAEARLLFEASEGGADFFLAKRLEN